ncbi:JAB domain-containing protein [Denitromonas sp.]|uniref:JAB domain-containing protein n=1 Tax=Denitromonas sp. TaxID=2734609 RepID=UPI003A88B662
MTTVDCTARRQREDRLIARAIKALERRTDYNRPSIDSPDRVRAYLKLRLGELEHEEFWAVWLDASNRVIDTDRMFTGSITQTSVYPREVVKRALEQNAAAAIIAHNHPSGSTKPSPADHELTTTLKSALQLVDVQLLDHFVIGHGKQPILSFAERGWI